jgi:hypothetical protein
MRTTSDHAAAGTSRLCQSVSCLPRTGLGNKLYIWARGWAFAQLNGLNFQCYGWTRLKAGTLLRREKSSRLYLGQFRHESLLTGLALGIRWFSADRVFDPPVEVIAKRSRSTLFIFRDLHANCAVDDTFRPFVGLREELRDALLARLTAPCRRTLEAATPPVVGIHVRRGDFRYFDWWQPIEDFCQRLQNVRQLAGACLPATVYSDGTSEELAPLLALPQVSLASPNPDIVDLLQLSRSQVLIASRASTFSNWAGFLSERVVLRDRKFDHQLCRPIAVNAAWFEGSVPDESGAWPALAKQNLQTIAAQLAT